MVLGGGGDVMVVVGEGGLVVAVEACVSDGVSLVKKKVCGKGKTVH